MTTERSIGEVERELARRFPWLRKYCGRCDGTGWRTTEAKCGACLGRGYHPDCTTDAMLGVMRRLEAGVCSVWSISEDLWWWCFGLPQGDKVFSGYGPTPREALCRALLAAAEGEAKP